MGLFYGLERALQPANDIGFGSHRLFHPTLKIGGHLGPGRVEHQKICAQMCISLRW